MSDGRPMREVTMKCPKCLQNSPSGATYCRQCGARLPGRRFRFAPLAFGVIAVVVLGGGGWGIFEAIQYRTTQLEHQRQGERRQNEQAWEYWRASATKLIAAVDDAGMNQVVFTDLEYSGGVSIPILGSTGHKESAERAQEGLFLLLQRIVSRSEATIKRGGSESGGNSPAVGFFSCRVVTFQEKGNRVRVETIRLELHRASDDVVLWADAWNVARLADCARPLDLDADP